jgi:hypothetical protein
MVNCCDLPAFLATEEVAPHGQLVDVAPKGPRDREELFRGDQEAEISCSVEVLRIRKKAEIFCWRKGKLCRWPSFTIESTYIYTHICRIDIYIYIYI